MDKRHLQRVKIVQELYSLSFNLQNKDLSMFDKKIITIEKNKNKIEVFIQKFAPKFSFDKIAKIDLAILYLSVYELALEKKEPPKVVIDEAIELAKEFGSERSYAFINAVLGKVYNEIYGGKI